MSTSAPSGPAPSARAASRTAIWSRRRRDPPAHFRQLDRAGDLPRAAHVAGQADAGRARARHQREIDAGHGAQPLECAGDLRRDRLGRSLQIVALGSEPFEEPLVIEAVRQFRHARIVRTLQLVEDPARRHLDAGIDQHQTAGGQGGHRRQGLADAGHPSRQRRVQADRHIRAQLQHLGVAGGEILDPPDLRQQPQRRGRVGGAAADPGGMGQCLGELDSRALRDATRRLQHPGRAQHGVALIHRHAGGKRPRHLERQICGG